MKVLGLAGSLRADSLNAQLLRLAAEELPAGVELDVYRGLAEIPPYDQDLEDLPSLAVEALKDAIAEADAVLLATPSTTARSRASSRTRSTGSRGPSATRRSGASPPP